MIEEFTRVACKMLMFNRVKNKETKRRKQSQKDIDFASMIDLAFFLNDMKELRKEHEKNQHERQSCLYIQ